ncbi:hypothetical protein L596_023140 [Steinernema carpocapsae]|nr:hypothetical protein L596_023140 [Steinernema carpocapsae]
MEVLPNVVVANLYSISECHDVAVEDLTKFHRSGDERKYAPVGSVIPGVKVAILDNNLRKVPIGVPGEIYVGGPTLAIGYLNRPELNKNRFLDVPEEIRNEVGSKMYRTGDWGYLLANQTLEICGRCDTLVKIRGYSIEIQAVESTILHLNWVASCSVIVIGAEGEDKQLAAYIVLKEPVTRKALRAELKRKLPFYMVPTYFVYLDKLPVLAASSKVDKKALPPVDPERDIVEASALPQTPTEIKLAKIWAEVLQRSALDIQESFFDLGGHSLLAARLLSKVATDFGVELNMRDLFASPTVSAMAKLLDGSERNSPETIVDLDQQLETHDYKDNGYRTPNGRHGLLGSHILARLLNSTQVRVVCLIRESKNESVDSRLVSSLKKRGLLTNSIKEQLGDRVKAMSGDVALVQFGLSEENFHLLTYDVDVVIHAAAYVNLIYPYQALHGINVLGTWNVLDFCHKNKVKPLHYISTDAVIPAGLNDVDEDFDIELVKEKLADGYGQTKFVAECMVRRSQQRGLPSIIYRLGNQSAATTAGYWNDADFTYLMLQAVIHTGKTPDIDWTLEITPVDFAAKFVSELATKQFTAQVGKTFHLTNSKGPKWSDLMDWIRKFGYRVEKIDADQWMHMIANSSDANLQNIQKLVAVMIRDESFFNTQSTYLRSNTDKFVAASKWRYPTVDERTVRHWMQLLVERHVIPSPSVSIGTAMVDKVVVITGASEGIGAAIARILAVEGGARVVLAARQEDKLKKLAKRLQADGCPETNILPLRCDVTKEEDVKKVVTRTIEQFGRIDVLVNCAGCMYYCMMKNGITAEWKRQIDVNCHGTMNMIGAVLPHMIERRQGHILNITSDAGKRGFAGLAVYSGSKFFIEGMTQALRQEMVEFGIRVTNIQPGDVATELAARSTDEEARAKFDGSNAGHRILDPEDVGRSVLFALSQPPHVAINELLIEPQAAPI